ncbi:MAG: zincin-like metallopeptidase domain-containing protein [Planctomycetia bacterium]|nr:zincin-like metallopeptidase domain-containing protein [Planctomycetia bacterium]
MTTATLERPRTETTTKTRTDIYTRVTSKIVEDLERGVRPWMKPWNAEFAGGRITRPLRHNGQAYKGINVLMLWASAEEQGLSCPYWLTFNQARELGGHVRKGEHGSPVVFASTFKKKDETDDGQEVESEIPFLKQYQVFNAEQCDGLPAHFTAPAEPPKETLQRIEQADAFFANTKADIRYGGNRAYYQITTDFVRMPPFETFRDAESHAATLAHELTHWTRHASRLNRELGRKVWGDQGYAAEELVAELGSAFLCADLSITPEVRDDHASYIDSWLKVLKQDKRAIFTAASHATKAVDFLHSLQPQPTA